MSPVLAQHGTSMAMRERRSERAGLNNGDEDWNCQAVGSDAPMLILHSLRALRHYHSATTNQPESFAEKFERLREKWLSETSFESSVSRMVANSAYQAIIGMGWNAVPFMLEDLRRAPQHWFWALRAITEVDPTPREARGDLVRMSECWVRWGISRNLIQP